MRAKRATTCYDASSRQIRCQPGLGFGICPPAVQPVSLNANCFNRKTAGHLRRSAGANGERKMSNKQRVMRVLKQDDLDAIVAIDELATKSSRGVNTTNARLPAS